MLAVLAPGQGSQKPGFLTPWLDLPGVTARLRWLSALAGVDLVHLGTKADAEEIKDTAKTQPLLVAAGLITADFLPMSDAQVVAGHSVGELTAAALAGMLTPETAVTLAAVRGREMAAACALEPTGMSAVLGGDPDEVLAAIAEQGLYPANRNGAGQVVAAGSLDGLARLKENPPAKAKVIPLQVAGAFHTPYMAPAQAALEAVAAGVTTTDPAKMLLSNGDGTAVTTGAEGLGRLVRQVTSPVRWDLCQDTMSLLGVTGIIELAPAGTLAGLAKRTLKGAEILTVNTPDDLTAAREFAARHATHHWLDSSVQFHVAVAPAAGSFTPAAVALGDPVSAGSVVGHVLTRQGAIDVVSAHTGVLVEWLADADDPVAPGAPLARLHPTGADR
ncbi:MAG TPA: acyltransferase domain-containing protein [Mycobacteriales bacterium]|nr:Acyl transferase [Cryptosporangiaceae bacterium]MDQ1674941.1 [acyl-carrier-protein] S-malonyltransferase [Actinomycetota bacterium]HEV7754594.1 acyltransferase domain-containing protein [Mycobacteriales bacterium]